ncbi:MAG: glycosyltransferase family 2 protein [Spirochaetia bacterium]|nr:glycosyltransferase family 2 protein [Spirochaetia bacterium]
MAALISVIAPVFNEEGNLQMMTDRLIRALKPLKMDYEILFINDGSSDSSLKILESFAQKNRKLKVLSFSRNFGHQTAVAAGLDYCKGDCVVIIDADLQDPPELISDLVEKWKEGFEVVYAQRSMRKGESYLKRLTASVFYRLLQKLANVNIPVDTGDFRLMDRKVVDVIRSMPERNKFIRGMVSWAGFRQVGVQFERSERHTGETKYTYGKMLRFALTGLTYFSQTPLQLASYLGFAVSAATFVYGLYVAYIAVFTNETVRGWPSIVLIVLFLGGIQLLTLGILGEYMGRISEEIKQRPIYVVAKKVNI